MTPSCESYSVRSRQATAPSGYKRYATFEGGWVIVDQNDFIVDSSERRANGITPTHGESSKEQLPAPTPAPRTETKAKSQSRDLLSAPKRNQPPESRYDGVDFFNAPKR
jgi:hypothetical protein